MTMDPETMLWLTYESLVEGGLIGLLVFILITAIEREPPKYNF